MDYPVIYVPGFDEIEVPGMGPEAIALTHGEPPAIGEPANAENLQDWQVVQTELFMAPNDRFAYLAVIVPSDKVSEYDPYESLFSQVNTDYPKVALSITLAPEGTMINYGWDVRGEAFNGRLFGGIEGPTGQPITVYTDWEVDSVQTFVPKCFHALSLFAQIHFCYCKQVLPIRELVTAS